MTQIRTELTELLGIEHPIVQDGMGPFQTAALAAAVSSAGGLGTVSMPGMTQGLEEGARLMREQIEKVAALTDRPFAVNVPVGYDPAGEVLPVTEVYVNTALEARRRDPAIRRRLVAIITSAGAPGDYTRRIHDEGLLHVHKVGAVRHALKAAANGVDALIASGYEMGGHTHETPVHTMVLAPQAIARSGIPVVVSGGIFDGRGLAAALAMGAAGVAMGTRFIATVENDWHDRYKAAVIGAHEGSDVILPGVYGPLRGLHNAGAEELLELARTSDDAALTRFKDERMIAAQRRGEVDRGLLPAGQCAAAITEIAPVGELLRGMVDDAGRLLRTAASAVQEGVVAA